MRIPPTTLSLACALVLLSTTAAGLLWTPLRTERDISRQAVSYPPLKLAVTAAKVAPASLATLRSSPLFYRRRETLQVEDPETIAASRPQYVLQAVVLAPEGRSFAYLKPVKGGEAIRVRPGASLDGWLVKAIDLRRVTAARGGQVAEILPLARAANAGLIRVPLSSAAVAPAIPAKRLLTAVGSNRGPSSAIQPHSEARTYRAPPAFARPEPK
jgi:hypothetical protein